MDTFLRSALPTQRPGHITVRSRFYAWRVNLRVLGYCLLALASLLLLATWAMTLGSFPIPFKDVANELLGRSVGEGKYADQVHFVIHTLRLPRVLCAILIGASLAMSGAIFQGLVRNPLVSPDIIGIDSGASVAAVFWIVTQQAPRLLPFAAFTGALVTAIAIYLLSYKGGIAPERLILVGIGIGASLAAWTTFLIIRYPTELARPAQVWTLGSVYGSSWADVRWLGGALLVFGIMGIVLTWQLRILQLGDDVSRGLGVPLERTRLLIIVTGCALAAVSVSIAGPIGFVALMVPHVARMLAGPVSGTVLLFAGLLGAIFLLLADVVGQHYLPVALPVGLVTAGVGAPYFLFLLYRTNVRM
ncbi:MAG TPA: iron ABC transporter permease [Thermomicrobiales bacterium]|nr:iron ABC transporter permease [Thermomicrobiales bacterium]